MVAAPTVDGFGGAGMNPWLTCCVRLGMVEALNRGHGGVSRDGPAILGRLRLVAGIIAKF